MPMVRRSPGSTSIGCSWIRAARRLASRRSSRRSSRARRRPSPLGRVELGPTPAHAHTVDFAVRPQELDPLDHANNAVYADWLDEAVIAAGDTEATRAIPRVARLEYALPAEAGALVESVVWPADEGWSYRLSGPEGNDLLRARLERG